MLGGVTTFLFASVATSGVRVLSYNHFTRRDRFVLAAALSFGFGDLLVPGIFTHLFDSVNAAKTNKGLQGLFDSITIVLSTPCEFRACYCGNSRGYSYISGLVLVAGLVSVILNSILPQEDAKEEGDEEVEIVDVESHPHDVVEKK